MFAHHNRYRSPNHQLQPITTAEPELVVRCDTNSHKYLLYCKISSYNLMFCHQCPTGTRVCGNS